MNDKHNIRRTINKIMRQKGRFPHKQEMCDLLNYSPEQVDKYMNALAEDGFIKKQGDWYIPIGIDENQEEIDPKIELQPETIDKETVKIIEDFNSEPLQSIIQETARKRARSKDAPVKKPRKKITRDTVSALALYVIKWSMMVVGIGSIIISIFYNTKMALEFLPFFLALIAGSIFVIFSVVSFEAIILFITYKRVEMWKRIPIVVGLGILWITVAVFSMSATLSGRYERYMVNQQSDSAENRGISVGRLKWQNIQDRKKNLKRIINDKREKMLSLGRISDKIDDIKSREEHSKIFVDTERRVGRLEDEINYYLRQLEQIRRKEAQHLELYPETTSADKLAGSYDDFYTWLGKIFGVTKDRVHFFISLSPAIFFDAISPIAIAFFLFLRRIE